MADYSYAVVGGGFIKKDVDSGCYLIFDTQGEAISAIHASVGDGDDLSIIQVDIKKANVV